MRDRDGSNHSGLGLISQAANIDSAEGRLRACLCLSVTQSQTVNQIATSTAVTASVAKSSYNQCVTFQAIVTGTARSSQHRQAAGEIAQGLFAR